MNSYRLSLPVDEMKVGMNLCNEGRRSTRGIRLEEQYRTADFDSFVEILNTNPGIKDTNCMEERTCELVYPEVLRNDLRR